MIYIYLFTARIINVFEFYMFARCLKMKFELVNQLLRESLTDLSKKNKKLGIFEVKDYAKIMDAEQRKEILSTKMLFQWRQRMQRRINVFMSKKQNAIASQTESHFPSYIAKQLPSASQNQRRNSIITKCQQHKHVLKVIKQVHLELCKVSKIVCAIFGVQIAWEIGIIIMALTGALYNLYIRYLMNQHKVKGLVSQTILMLSMCALHTMKAVFLNRSCKSAADEGNRTTEIIRTIYDCDADIDMREEIQQFGIQILQSPMTFSVDGFTLDYRVLSMILKNVTTYMVIMVQVSNSLESNNAIEYSHF
ncbi:PREDICTED: uncharacterized protein LOC105564933 [Vollenhovia emeryi]|uniref:uncharacterized protein LOC105564933 n=1 Tax=Vollenhovia emeryi TaxID=411798 RepID=UPI0005F4476E|nr:PREDICTED: uncharacterized protein LOC105564933 [Vollenhovia emeryi]